MDGRSRRPARPRTRAADRRRRRRRRLGRGQPGAPAATTRSSRRLGRRARTPGPARASAVRLQRRTRASRSTGSAAPWLAIAGAWLLAVGDAVRFAVAGPYLSTAAGSSAPRRDGDRRRHERGQVGRAARGDEVAVDDDLGVLPLGAGVAQVVGDRVHARSRGGPRRSGRDRDPAGVADERDRLAASSMPATALARLVAAQLVGAEAARDHEQVGSRPRGPSRRRGRQVLALLADDLGAASAPTSSTSRPPPGGGSRDTSPRCPRTSGPIITGGSLARRSGASWSRSSYAPSASATADRSDEATRPEAIESGDGETAESPSSTSC